MLTPIDLDIPRKMQDNDYRVAFLVSRLVDDVAATIIEARESAGLSQQQLGQKCGMKQSAIAMLENGDTRATLRTLVRVFDALSLRPTFIAAPLRKERT